MNSAQEKIYTTKDIYALPDGQRAELIDGQLYMMAPPNFKHQKIIMELSSVIHQYIKRHGGDCEVLPAPFAVFSVYLWKFNYQYCRITIIAKTAQCWSTERLEIYPKGYHLLQKILYHLRRHLDFHCITYVTTSHPKWALWMYLKQTSWGWKAGKPIMLWRVCIDILW